MPLPTIESAIPPAIHLSGARDVAIERGEVTWLSFQAGPRVGTIAIDVPAGTQVVGLELETERHDPIWGEPRPAPSLVHEPAELLDDNGGAVIARASASGGEDHLVLQLRGPACGDTDVVHSCDERVTLAMILPAIDRVEISPAPSRVDGRRATTAMIAVAAHAVASVQHVGEDTALVARHRPTVFFDTHVARVPRELDKTIIRRRIREHMAQLRWCYVGPLQRTPKLAGTVEVQFVIAPDGHVATTGSAGDLASAEVRACLAHVVEQWQFPETDETVRVNYPITFKPES